MSRHVYGSCHDEDCVACEHVAERVASGDDERDQYTKSDVGRMMDGRAADAAFGRAWQ